ncbi:MAG: DUF4116 domain-containing protein [Sphingobacteriales bacterium]|jgi:CxxC motif-containing protein
MKEIKRVLATEDLLKRYILKLYSRKNQIGDLCFDETKINSLIVNKSYSELTYSELVDCCSISARWTNEDFQQYTPNEFYYFEDNKIHTETIQEQPFLYTSINPLEFLPLFLADFGLYGIGSDITDTNGNILLSIYSNLYDDGYFKVIVLSDKTIIVYSFDKNNADGFDLYQYDAAKNKLIKKYLIEDKSQILSIIEEKDCPMILSMANDELRNNKEIVLAALRRDPYCFRHAGEVIKNEKDIILAALSAYPDAFLYAAEELQNNKEFLLNCIKINPEVCEFISSTFQNDQEIIQYAVSCDGMSLQYASEELKNNREIVLTAITKNGMSIQYASLKLRDDIDIVSAAKNSAGTRVLKYASERIRGDNTFVDDIKSRNENINNDFDIDNLPF